MYLFWLKIHQNHLAAEPCPGTLGEHSAPSKFLAEFKDGALCDREGREGRRRVRKGEGTVMHRWTTTNSH